MFKCVTALLVSVVIMAIVVVGIIYFIKRGK